MMKKFVAILIMLLCLTGCGMNTAKNAVDCYMKKYKTLDSEVLVDMENTIELENLNESQKELYRDVLKKQYKDLKYKIIDEQKEDDKTYITVKVTVYDLYKANKNTADYFENNREEFNNENGEYDVDKYLEFKLNKMKKTTDTIEHTIKFTVVKEEDKYVVEQLSNDDLLKIHGIYNYDNVEEN